MINWHKLVKALKEECPTQNRRIVVKRVCMKHHANTGLSENEKIITVTIRKQDSRTIQEDSLIHEWGHVIDYDLWDSHGKQWGEWMAEAYKVLERFRS